MPVKLFLCHAHEDEPLLDKLKSHLSPLRRQGLIQMWHDRDISAGTEWEKEIDKHLNTAEIILLLISPDFMASDYCFSTEMQQAMERHELGEAVVIPIILRPVLWKETPLGKLQALPTDGKPVVSSQWHNLDEAFVDVADGIRRAIKELTTEKALSVTKQQGLMPKNLLSNEQDFSYVGKQIGNNSVLKALGSGTYGQIYWGKQGVLTTQFVAIKILNTAYLDSHDKRDSFLLEAQFLRRLKHSHILPIIDAGLHEGLPFIVTEYAPHGSLRDLLNHQFTSPLPINETQAILSQIGQALSYAHQHNIIHRDLKPENILFSANHQVLLSDFGSATVVTTTGNKRIEIAGTPQYMAPEQFAGDASMKSDQYALGCIAYELLTGHPPFVTPYSDFISMWFKHIYSDPVSPRELFPQLPVHIERAILKALAKDSRNRHPDVSTFIMALHDAKGNFQQEEDLSPYRMKEDKSSNLFIRRLPIYILVDCSQSLAGNAIIAMREGICMIQLLLMADRQARETVYISVIYYSNYVNQTRLVPIDEFILPTLVAGSTSGRSLGSALYVLVESIQQDLVLNTPTHHGDYRPLVFLLTDGAPTDNYQDAIEKLQLLRGSQKPTIIALGCGDAVNKTMLRELTENVFLMHTANPENIKGFFRWMSGSITTISD